MPAKGAQAASFPLKRRSRSMIKKALPDWVWLPFSRRRRPLRLHNGSTAVLGTAAAGRQWMAWWRLGLARSRNWPRRRLGPGQRPRHGDPAGAGADPDVATPAMTAALVDEGFGPAGVGVSCRQRVLVASTLGAPGEGLHPAKALLRWAGAR